MNKPVQAGYEFADESEQEENVIKPQEVAQVVLSSTDWTVQTILSQLEQNNIDLQPRFQRRDAWTRGRKGQFIESLILGLPVPEVVLAEHKDRRGEFLVLDGKQRLLTLYQFAGKAQGKNNAFKLSGLEVRPDLNGLTYQDLQLAEHAAERKALLNSTIRSVVIRNWPSIEFLHIIFVRLNTGSVSLSPQELRQALFPGPFLEFVYDKATESKMLRVILGTDEPDFRMRDVELLVRYLAFAFFVSDYAGNLRGFLDNTCDQLTANWDALSPAIEARVGEFEEAVAATIEIFGIDNIMRKWNGVEFEGRPNRAILDVMAFYFANDQIRKSALKKSAAVVRAYKRLCTKNDVFVKSIESTTKSLTATYQRLSIWGEALSDATGLRFNIPTWDEKARRITFNGF